MAKIKNLAELQNMIDSIEVEHISLGNLVSVLHDGKYDFELESRGALDQVQKSITDLVKKFKKIEDTFVVTQIGEMAAKDSNLREAMAKAYYNPAKQPNSEKTEDTSTKQAESNVTEATETKSDEAKKSEQSEPQLRNRPAFNRQ